MKFAMYSKCGEGAGLLKRIQDEGNECRLFIREHDYKSVYDGILDKSDGLFDHDEIIIFDSSDSGQKADSLRRSGYKVFGASRFHDVLEQDREFGLDFMRSNKIKYPNSQEFFKIPDGIEFIKKHHDKRYVFKPCGDLPSRLTYCSSGSDDLVEYLKYVEKFYKNKIDSFILQEFLEGHIISTEIWMGNSGLCRPLTNHTTETKKLMNDDLGPSTGCSGNIVWPCEIENLIVKLMYGLEKDLFNKGYIGPIDLNCIVSNGVPYGLEWTPRFGLDAMPTFLGLVNGDIGKLIYDLMEGNKIKDNILISAIAAGVRITIPPYPIELDDAKVVQKNAPNKGIPIRGLDSDGTYYYEVMRDDSYDLFHSDGTGVIAVVSDWSEDIDDVFSNIYDILDECQVPDKQYRTDLRSVLTKMYEDVTKEIKNASVSAA